MENPEQSPPDKVIDPNIEISGKFRYFKKYLFCCEKMIFLYFDLTHDNLLFYSDEQRKKLFLSVPKSSVIAINKRQIDKNDVFKFSIYYKNEDEEIIHELKLKTEGRADTERWILRLKKLINPKKYEFKYDKENYIDANELFHFRDSREFYIRLCHLEYILLRNKMMDFFKYYKIKVNKWNGSNNNSGVFYEESDTERLNRNLESSLNINDIQAKIAE